jgi:acyl-CoA thioesterase II
MNPLVADVLKVLQLKRLDEDVFEGESRDLGQRRVFGGQVLGQALAAAYGTVEKRRVHSLHAYFLRAGDPDHPIVYQVDRSRDGASFSSRRVVAIQHNAQIFHMSASFHAGEEAADRYTPMPDTPAPEDVPEMSTAVAELARRAPDRPRPFLDLQRALEFRPALMPHFEAGVPTDPHMKIWFKSHDPLPDDQVLHDTFLAYASDYYLLGAAGLDLRLSVDRSDLQVASIDHAMWFHRPMRIDEWLLYVIDSPSNSNSRGLSLGKIYSRDGRLVASTAQEGLIRRR